MIGTALRVLVIGGIAWLIMPAQTGKHGNHESPLAQFIGNSSPAQVASGGRGKPSAVDAMPIHAPLIKQREALAALSSLQSPEAISKNIQQTVHRNGWDKSARKGLKQAVSLLDGLRAKLVASEHAIQ